jgi:hypothetical protein
MAALGFRPPELSLNHDDDLEAPSASPRSGFV